MKIAGVAYTLVIMDPDDPHGVEEIDLTLDLSLSGRRADAAAWERLIGEAQANYRGDMRVRGMSGLYGETIVDCGEAGKRLDSLIGTELGR